MVSVSPAPTVNAQRAATLPFGSARAPRQQREQVDVLHLLHGGEALLQREQPVAQRVVDRCGKGDCPAQGLNHRQHARACPAGLRCFGVAERRHIHLHAVFLHPRQHQRVGLRAVARVLQARLHQQGRRVRLQRVGEGHLRAHRLAGQARGLVDQRQAFVGHLHAQHSGLARAARRDDFERRWAQRACGKQPPRVGDAEKLLAEKVLLASVLVPHGVDEPAAESPVAVRRAVACNHEGRYAVAQHIIAGSSVRFWSVG
jgi:hypothetical protein